MQTCYLRAWHLYLCSPDLVLTIQHVVINDNVMR